MSQSITYPQSILEVYRGRTLPRGIRNNNPGNIRLGDKWQGLCDLQADPSFCQFLTAEYGIRALSYILRVSYYQRLKLKTVQAIINRWAPSSENNTDAYVQAVASQMRVSDDEDCDLFLDLKLCDMVQAIIKHENGSQPYLTDTIMGGIKMVPGSV